jgi:hypothetical protein
MGHTMEASDQRIRYHLRRPVPQLLRPTNTVAGNTVLRQTLGSQIDAQGLACWGLIAPEHSLWDADGDARSRAIHVLSGL